MLQRLPPSTDVLGKARNKVSTSPEREARAGLFLSQMENEKENTIVNWRYV
jgi:hypothetical protein